MFTLPSGADTEMTTTSEQIQPGCFVSGPTSHEPIDVLVIAPTEAAVKFATEHGLGTD